MVHYTDVYFDEDSQSYVVGASGVLRTAAGEVRGVAAADVYLDSISQIVSGVQIEDTGGIFLVDTRTDTIIGHRDAEITGQRLGEIQDDTYTYISSKIQQGSTGLELYNISRLKKSQAVIGSLWHMYPAMKYYGN